MHTKLLGDHSECDPPDPISNSEVKPFSADGSVGSPHVRVGHRQALIDKALIEISGPFLCLLHRILSFHSYALLSTLITWWIISKYNYSN